MFIRLFIGSILMLLTTQSMGQTHYTTGIGSWEGNSIWGGVTTGPGNAWVTRTILASDIIYIDDDITLDTDLTILVDVRIVLDAALSLEKKLRLTENSSIEFTENGSLIGVGSGNSEKISFGGNFVWSGNDGDLTGPGTMDKNFNGSLPISLAYFEVTPEDNSVKVTWITATEENNDYFEILRSRNGVEYNVIATIDGAGNSTQALSYEYVDNKPLFGQSYYKLKQTDFDGKNETFSAKGIYVSTLADLVFSPNPVESGNKITIYTGANSDETVSVEVLSVSGKSILSKRVEGGNNDLTIPAEIERGVYFLKVASGNKQFVKRLLIK